jgi:ABC-type tungstate transport system permease subunit
MDPLTKKEFLSGKRRAAAILRSKKIDAETIRGISARMMPQTFPNINRGDKSGSQSTELGIESARRAHSLSDMGYFRHSVGLYGNAK